MIDLDNVKVTGKMLMEWAKHTNKDPVMLENLSVKDILYAYYLMCKSVDSNISEDQAYSEIEGKDIMKVIKAFFPAMSIPKEDIPNPSSR